MNSADLAGARWRKSSHSGTEGNCVGEWAAFSAGMADGGFAR